MSRTFRLLLVASLGWLAVSLPAQCATTWSTGGPQPELSGLATCTTLWDPDGAGPAVQRLVVGGQNLLGGSNLIGGQPSHQGVMTWDGTQWESLASGPGVLGSVNALTVWNGLLVAGGSFTGGAANFVALWSGSAWQPLGAGFPLAVTALTVWNGNLVAVSQSGGVPVVETWNGVGWTALPTPPNLMFPNAAVSYQGFLCVAGVENSPTQGVLERWNGTSWQPSIFAQQSINCLAVRFTSIIGGSDTLFAAGAFSSIGGVTASRIAATSGGASFTWSPVGSGLPANCSAFHVRPSGAFGAAVVAVIASATTPIVQLSGSTFVAMGNAPLNSLAYYGGAYHGSSAASGDDACQRWDGSQWSPVRGPGIAGEVHALCRSGDDMIVGGTFASISGTNVNHVARWDGTSFQALGPGLPGTSVDALVTLANGDIVAGGQFPAAGSPAINHVARWNGTNWSPLAVGFSQPVLALCTMSNGDVVAGGKFTTAGGLVCNHIARWNGTSWSALGSGMDGDVMALAVRPDDTLFAGGSFAFAGGVACSRIAQWNGTAWIQVGAGTNGDVQALAVRPNNDIVAVGAFTAAGGLPADRCARWTGSSWASMGAASGDAAAARAVVVLPNGDVVAGRGFQPPSTVPDAGIARWNGSAWSGFATGLAAHYPSTSVSVRALAQSADGDLIVGGSFSAADGAMSYALARLSSACPPAAAQYGAGCSSAAGLLTLAADTLPFIGAPFRTTTTGVASGSLCLSAIGFTQLSIPLDAILAEGQPGCSLLDSLDILSVILPDATNAAHSAFALANDPSLIGVPFFQQTIPLEFDALGALAAIRGSNGLSLVIGTF